jgi:hypothetical protein
MVVMTHSAILRLQPEIFSLICSFLTTSEIFGIISRISKKWSLATTSASLALVALRATTGLYTLHQSAVRFHPRYDYPRGERRPARFETEEEKDRCKTHGRCIVYNRRIYRFGGRTSQEARLNTCEFFDPAASGGGQWTELPPMKSVRSACGVGVVRGKAYVIGGCDDNGEVATYEVFDLTTHQWLGNEPRPMPHGVCEHAVAVHGDAIYIVGGCIGRFKLDERSSHAIFMFQPHLETDAQWKQLPVRLPAGFILGDAKVVSDNLVLFGGSPVEEDLLGSFSPIRWLYLPTLFLRLDAEQPSASLAEEWHTFEHRLLNFHAWNTFATASISSGDEKKNSIRCIFGCETKMFGVAFNGSGADLRVGALRRMPNAASEIWGLQYVD